MGRLILLLVGIACIYGILGLKYSDVNFILKWILQVLLAVIVIFIGTTLFEENNSGK